MRLDNKNGQPDSLIHRVGQTRESQDANPAGKERCMSKVLKIL